MEMNNAAPQKQNDLPEKQCDLVMKGGITSGIVYPPALYELARKYRLNSIGGTSAGAIAAAGAAAAEYRRANDVDDRYAGFTALNDMARDLGAKDKLFRLFDAPKGIQPIMRLLSALGTFGGATGPDQSPLVRLREKVLQPIRFIRGVFQAAWPYFLVAGIVMGLVGVVVGNALAHFLNGFNLPPAEMIVSIVLTLATGVTVVFATSAWKAGLSEVARLFLIGVGVTALICLIFAFLLPWIINLIFNNRFTDPGFALSVFFAAILFVVGGTVAGLFHILFGIFLKRVPENFYGVVNGHDADKYREQDAGVVGNAGNPKPGRPENPTMLTDWLSVQLDTIAGLEDTNCPLTFGHLCSAGITLKMITTNVSQGIPYELPFTANKSRLLLFNINDMRRLFPAYIVRYMMENASDDDRYKLPDGFHFMPAAEHLPVAFAMRMSLAVPLFISAIPIYTMNADVKAEPGEHKPLDVDADLQLNYFGDGGTCSNFPIHLFDRWLPTRPTFAITLVTVPKGGVTVSPGHASITSPRATSTDQVVSANRVVSAKYRSAVYTPSSQENVSGRTTESALPAMRLLPPNEPQPPTWRPVTNPIDYIFKVIDTARENHDTLQSMLPGYKERILPIYLNEGEGGINLAMGPNTITNMMSRGTQAGQVLRDFKFAPHRWTRFLTLMSSLETELDKLEDSFYRESLNYRELILTPSPPAHSPASTIRMEDNNVDPKLYHRNEEVWRKDALRRLAQLVEIAGKWEKETVSVPEAVLGAPAHPDPKPLTLTQVAHKTASKLVAHPVCPPTKDLATGECDPMKRKRKLKFFNDDNLKTDSPDPQPMLRSMPDLSKQ